MSDFDKNVKAFVTSAAAPNPMQPYIDERQKYYDGLSDERRKVLDSNPYLDFQYKVGAWDDIASSLGFRSGRDVAFEEQLQAARKWDSDYLGVFREEDYNNAVNSAERMRASGQNPDLIGVSPQAAGQASEHTEDEGILSRSGTSSTASEFINGVGGVITTILGAASQLGEIKSLNLANRGKAIENDIASQFGVESASVDFYQKLLTSAVNHVANFMNEDDFKQVQYDVEHGIKPTYVVSRDITGFSRKTNSRYNQIISSLFKGIKTREDFFNKYGSYLENRTDVAVKKGSKYYTDDDEALTSVVQELSSLNEDIMKLSLQYQKKELQFGNQEIDYQSKVVDANTKAEIPEKSAESAAAGFESEKELKDFRSELQKVVNGHIQKLSSKAEDKGFLGALSSLACTLLYMLSTNMISMPALPTSSRSVTHSPAGTTVKTTKNSIGF